MPPRRPASIISRPEFGESLVYLRLAAETRREDRIHLEWWEAFLLEAPPVLSSEQPADEIPTEKRRKRRRKPRRPRRTVV